MAARPTLVPTVLKNSIQSPNKSDQSIQSNQSFESLIEKIDNLNQKVDKLNEDKKKTRITNWKEYTIELLKALEEVDKEAGLKWRTKYDNADLRGFNVNLDEELTDEEKRDIKFQKKMAELLRKQNQGSKTYQKKSSGFTPKYDKKTQKKNE